MSAELTSADWHTLDCYSFGDTPTQADELVQLVIDGKKTATCWAADGKLSEIGKHMVILDGADRPIVVVETIELTQRKFNEVDAAFARDEGEGDGSLDCWRAEHQRYFTQLNQFSPDMFLWCERFRIIQILDRSIS